MNSNEIRQKFLNFFIKRNHIVIPSASLITTDEKGVTNSTLFNSAGMQPLIPYLLGKIHPKGKRLVDVQKCVRTVDLDDIGDKTHATFFEMLGNWSLGDYFKEDAIKWSYEFLTDKNEGLGLDPSRLYVTVFEGDSIAEKDEEAANIWKKIFDKNNIKGERIFFLPAENNWWQAGENGPCGPDTEMYYDIKNKFNGSGLTREQFLQADSVREVVEVWNDVFMQFEKQNGKIIGKLKQQSVDTGAGLERILMTIQNVDNIYDTDLFKPIMDITLKMSDSIRSARIIADHFRTSVFLIAEGVIPSNTDRGYVLRRLLRKAIFNTKNRRFDENDIDALLNAILNKYNGLYPELNNNRAKIKEEIVNESTKFTKVIEDGIKEINKMKSISGKDAFTLYSSFGFPIELTQEIAKEKGININRKEFEEELKKHQDISRSGAEQKFKGGLADSNDPMIIRYHTATHLLHQALFDVLGNNVGQKGSNITAERLRFDFSYPTKMTDEQKKKVEDIVNEKINASLPVKNIIMPKDDAMKTNARHFFGEKYGDQISIYYIGDNFDSAYSKEFCGGPHVKNTGELKGDKGNFVFKIQKEEAVSAGVRRIKAVLV